MSKLKKLWRTWRINKANALDLLLSQLNQSLRPTVIKDCVPGSGNQDSRVLLSYRTEPFRSFPRLPKFNDTNRPNVWQAGEIARLFSQRGFAVDAYRFDCDDEPHDFDHYDVLFGIEPNFNRFAKSVPEECTKIYYATGMHWSQRNPAIRSRADVIRNKKGKRPDLPRILPETTAEEKADYIVVIGDELTAKTYKDYLGDISTFTIQPTGHELLFHENERNYERAKKNFLWFSGSGFVTKGLDVVLEAFSQRPDLNLYVCGPLGTATSFVDLYWDELFETDNIHPIGWTEVGSERFQEITAKCGYIILPSISEGFPTAIVDGMERGLVPIITPEVFEDPGDWGIQLADSDTDTIVETIDFASSIDSQELRKRSETAYKKAKEEFTREAYSNRMKEILNQVLG